MSRKFFFCAAGPLYTLKKRHVSDPPAGPWDGGSPVSLDTCWQPAESSVVLYVTVCAVLDAQDLRASLQVKTSPVPQ